MSFFDDILRNRNIKWNNDIYLWRLRLSNDEFYELKEVLKQGAKFREFKSLHREATLYYAEWYRREFDGGHAGIEDVCTSLLGNTQLHNELYEAAQQGARLLKIQIIRTHGEFISRDNIKYSIFYQGGLPMNYIIGVIRGNNNSSWDRFFRKLVWKLHDYTDVSESLGITAPLSDSLKTFCETLRISADRLMPNLQPYYHNEVWWNIIIRNFEEEKKKRKARTPFELVWLFKFDDVEKNVGVEFKFFGPQTLSSEFIEEHNLSGRSYTTFSVQVNNTPIFNPEYDKRFYCRRNVEKRVQCSIWDTVKVVVNETGEVISNRDINFDIPKVVYLVDEVNNIFRIGDSQHLKDEVCRIIATEDWETDCEFDTFNISGNNYKVFYPKIESDEIILSSKVRNEIRTICSGKETPKTFIDFNEALKLQVPTKEIIFNTFNIEQPIHFYEAYNETEINRAHPRPVYYAEKGSQQWINSPKIGVIRARIRRPDNEAVEPVKFINTGNLDISCIFSSRDKCEIKINWEYGCVEPVEKNEAKVGDQENLWIINRSDLTDPRYVKFKFMPRYSEGSEFFLTILPPFLGFAIYNKQNRSISNKSIIPMVDINDFRYYLHCSDNIQMYPSRVGDLKYVYYYDDNSRSNRVVEYFCNNRQRSSLIPFEGSLASLFMDGSEQISRMLNHSCLSLPNAITKISFQIGDQRKEYNFKAFPYRLKYDKESGMVIVKNISSLPRYDAELLAIPIDNPEKEPIVIKQSMEYQNCYLLPELITNSEYTKWLIYGSLRGYILPFAIDTQISLDNETRDYFRAEKIKSLKQEFLEKPIYSDIWLRTINWYKRLPLGRIPGTSILELVAISDDNMLIKKFALHLWFDALNSDSLNTLTSSLIEFSEQMSFLWAWVSRETIKDYAREYLESDETIFLKYYYTWVLSLPNDSDKKNNLLTNPEHRSVDMLLSGFEDWLSILISEGMPTQTFDFPDINNNGDGLNSEEARNHFVSIRNIINNQGNLSRDELWIQERYRASSMFQEIFNFGNIEGSEEIKYEIRKSIILGLTYNNDYEF